MLIFELKWEFRFQKPQINQTTLFKHCFNSCIFMKMKLWVGSRVIHYVLVPFIFIPKYTYLVYIVTFHQKHTHFHHNFFRSNRKYFFVVFFTKQTFCTSVWVFVNEWTDVHSSSIRVQQTAWSDEDGLGWSWSWFFSYESDIFGSKKPVLTEL